MLTSCAGNVVPPGDFQSSKLFTHNRISPSPLNLG